MPNTDNSKQLDDARNQIIALGKQVDTLSKKAAKDQEMLEKLKNGQPSPEDVLLLKNYKNRTIYHTLVGVHLTKGVIDQPQKIRAVSYRYDNHVPANDDNTRASVSSDAGWVKVDLNTKWPRTVDKIQIYLLLQNTHCIVSKVPRIQVWSHGSKLYDEPTTIAWPNNETQLIYLCVDHKTVGNDFTIYFVNDSTTSGSHPDRTTFLLMLRAKTIPEPTMMVSRVRQ